MYYIKEFVSVFDAVKWMNNVKISPDRIVAVLPIPIVTVIYLD